MHEFKETMRSKRFGVKKTDKDMKLDSIHEAVDIVNEATVGSKKVSEARQATYQLPKYKKAKY